MKIAVLGYGTVGRGVCEIIRKTNDFELVKVLERPEKCTENFMVSDIEDIVKDSSIEAVVECMGGIDFAFLCAAKAIDCGKHFVTSNKALVAAKGLELKKKAEEKGVSFLFSAACGGAIPVLHNLAIARETDEIISVKGILNGTTNFILTKMADEGLDYKTALSMAQKLGYAEADPTADVSGLDTLRKVMLSSAVSFGILPVEGCLNEGIENVKTEIPLGYELRLLGTCARKGDKICAFVQPSLVRKDSLFASVKANNNMVVYEGKYCASIALGGQGAGMYPTASAVLRDLTALLNGNSNMFKPSCIAGKADNSSCEYKYYAVENGKSFTVNSSVSAMFEQAADSRKRGNSFFFAAFED